MKFMRLIKSAGALCAVALMAATPAQAARSFGTQYVTDIDGDGFAAAHGNISVYAVSARNYSWVRVSNLEGKGGYTVARFWNTRGTYLGVRSRDSGSSGYKNVSNSALISGSTAGPWSGAVKTCINRRFWFDPCTSESQGRL